MSVHNFAPVQEVHFKTFPQISENFDLLVLDEKSEDY